MTRFPKDYQTWTDARQSEFLRKNLWHHGIGTGGFLNLTHSGTLNKSLFCDACNLELLMVERLDEAFEHIETDRHREAVLLQKLGA